MKNHLKTSMEIKIITTSSPQTADFLTIYHIISNCNIVKKDNMWIIVWKNGPFVKKANNEYLHSNFTYKF